MQSSLDAPTAHGIASNGWTRHATRLAVTRATSEFDNSKKALASGGEHSGNLSNDDQRCYHNGRVLGHESSATTGRLHYLAAANPLA